MPNFIWNLERDMMGWDWVRVLICCFTVGLAICFKSEREGFFVVVAVTLAFEIKIKGKREP